MSDIPLAARDFIDPTELSIRDALSSFTEAWNERIEYELHGAWRAGYKYVHIYTDDAATQPLGTEPLETTFTSTRYIHTSHTTTPPEPDDLEYLYSYDLTLVPDHILRAAFRGELDEYERANLTE